MANCLFCRLPAERVIAENALAFVIRDGYPVTPLHTLVIPKRHAIDFFDMTEPEIAACVELLRQQKASISAEDPSVAAFNIGVNAGAVAGQTIFHSHTT